MDPSHVVDETSLHEVGVRASLPRVPLSIRLAASKLTSSELLRVWIREHEIRPHPFPEGNKRMLNNRKLLASQFKDRELDSRVVGLLKRHLHLVAELDIVDSLSHQTAFHDHAFIQ